MRWPFNDFQTPLLNTYGIFFCVFHDYFRLEFCASFGSDKTVEVETCRTLIPRQRAASKDPKQKEGSIRSL